MLHTHYREVTIADAVSLEPRRQFVFLLEPVVVAAVASLFLAALAVAIHPRHDVIIMTKKIITMGR